VRFSRQARHMATQDCMISMAKSWRMRNSNNGWRATICTL
jgi:hypothetical protein